MSDASDDTAHVTDGAPLDSKQPAPAVSDRIKEASSLEPHESPHKALLSLMKLGPDTVIDQLCEGTPRDFRMECRRHLKDSAYFIEEGRLAARVIATLSGLAAGASKAPDVSEQEELDARLDTIIEESLASLLDEGALIPDPGEAPDPTTQRIGLVLGLDPRGARSLIDTLNRFDFADRHVLFHCVIEGLSPEAYAREFQDDARVITVMLRKVAAMAIDGPGEEENR